MAIAALPADPAESRNARLICGLNHAFALLMLVGIAVVLTAAMVMQYVFGELPCPLCLLQRVALFGIGFALAQNFRNGFSHRNTGIGLTFALLLLIVSVRQTLLDIVPRPGHSYVGSTLFGLHMPVWSVIIATLIIAGYAAAMTLFGGERQLARHGIASFPVIGRLADVASAYLIVICLVNLGSVVVQCGFGECHTMGYKLIQSGWGGLWAR
ncbi:disulfide bond formation protein B [Phreatobacter sp.]|uniref:disulfide bond formation protein B n=1 Tax=Phreatobacter sp. TaxID=1966341 RepID=UPI003F724337